MKFQHVLAGLALTGSALGAEVQQVTEDIGFNPTLVQLWTYVPDELKNPKPAIVISLHACPSDLGGQDKVWNTPLMEAADATGDFIILFPLAHERYQAGFNCWDVTRDEPLTHDGVGVDATGILNGLKWALQKYSGDANRVFVTGISWGGQMAITLAATHPEAFAAVAAYSAVPFACMRGSLGPYPLNTNRSCAHGEIHRSPEEWAGFVLDAYPGYTGAYPRMMILFGDADVELNMPQVGHDTLAQWAAVLRVESTANLTGPAVDQGPQYTELVYGDGTKLVGYHGHEVDHMVPIMRSVLLRWFGLGSPEMW